MDIDGFAFIIGASGIGKACALAFAKHGARGIVLADLDIEAAKAVVAECKSVSGLGEDFLAEAITVDVRLEDSVDNATAYASHTLGRIDYCVHSAGVGVQVANEIAEASVEEYDNMFKINVTGTFLVTRAVSAKMKKQKPRPVSAAQPARGSIRGSIVILGSASAFVATSGMVQYTSAKHAVLGITKNAALDNAPHGIRVNSVCPSWVDTPMIRKAMQDIPTLESMITSAVPMGRIALADEVADAVMFLSSPRASYAIGCNLILDGGTTLSSKLL